MSEGPATPFRPSYGERHCMPLFAENTIPRYLFRVHDYTSAGITTTSHVIPGAVRSKSHGMRDDIFSYPPDTASEELHRHFTWNTSAESHSNFTSWTSSLLFALQYGFFRHQRGRNPVSLENIHLTVIDTQDFRPGIFVKDLEIMKALCSSSPRITPLHAFLAFRENPTSAGEEFYFGEYLSQGDLGVQGSCAQTSMHELISMGLYDLQPAFADERSWGLWSKAVLEHRRPFMSPPSPEVTQADVRKAIVLAATCFGQRWAVPVATMIFALQPRQSGGQVLVDGMTSMFTGMRQALTGRIVPVTDR